MDRRIAVSEFVTATCAPAIAPPELSLTLPEIVPPATCARQALPVTSAIAVTHATVQELEFKAAQFGFGSISTFLRRRIRSNASGCRSAVSRQGMADLISKTCAFI